MEWAEQRKRAVYVASIFLQITISAFEHVQDLKIIFCYIVDISLKQSINLYREKIFFWRHRNILLETL